MGGRRHVTAIVLVYKVPPADRAPHFAFASAEPVVLHAPGIQRDSRRTDGADMGRAMVARLGLGLLLLALLLPTQVRPRDSGGCAPAVGDTPRDWPKPLPGAADCDSENLT